MALKVVEKVLFALKVQHVRKLLIRVKKRVRSASDFKLCHLSVNIKQRLSHLVVVVNRDQLVSAELVVWLVDVVKTFDVVEDVFHLRNFFGWAHPKSFFGMPKTFCLDFLDLVNRVVTLFTPLQLLVQEVEHGEVEAPNVVTARKVNVIVRV